MQSYLARDLMSYSLDDVWKLPQHTKIELTFDDGVLVTSTERTIISWYYWAIHRHFPDTPLNVNHHIGNNGYSNKIHSSTINNVYKSWYLSNNDLFASVDQEQTADKELIWEIIYDDITNLLYNDVDSKLAANVGTVSFLDYLDVMESPDIERANAKTVASQKSIDITYDKVTKSLNNEPTLNDNNLARMVRSATVDIKQVRQSVSVRGFVTEINSKIFPEPVLTGFASGLNSLYSAMVESRSASKALVFAKDFLANCEYFNRKLQLVCMSLDTLALGDCGTDITYDYLVEPNELSSLYGICYVNDSGQLDYIKDNDVHLIGKTLKIRAPWGCMHPDDQTICSVCAGVTSTSLPYATNPGHVSALTLGKIISQLVLSTKHEDSSSTVDGIVIDEIFQSLIRPGSDMNSILLSSDLIGKKVELILNRTQAVGLPTLPDATTINDPSYNVAKDSVMKSVTLAVYDEGSDEPVLHEVPTSMGTRNGSLSRFMLTYIKHKSFILDENGNYVIDITALTKDNKTIANPIFVLPFKHTSMIDFQKEVEQFVLTSGRKYGLCKYTNPMDAVKELLTLVNSRITINMTHIMIIAYCMSVRDVKNCDYRFPRAGGDFKFSTLGKIMHGRSLGGALSFQGQENIFTNHESYVKKIRPRHPMDELILG